MLTVLLTIIGLTLGLVLTWDLAGTIVGATLGYLIGRVQSLSGRVAVLQFELRHRPSNSPPPVGPPGATPGRPGRPGVAPLREGPPPSPASAFARQPSPGSAAPPPSPAPVFAPPPRPESEGPPPSPDSAFGPQPSSQPPAAPARPPGRPPLAGPPLAPSSSAPPFGGPPRGGSKPGDGTATGAPPPSDPLTDALTAARNYLMGINTVVQVGVVVLLVGIGLLAKWAADNSLFPVELRLATAAGLAIVLIGFGWRLRHVRPGYAVSLQGGGIGIIYLVTFFAHRLYGLLETGSAFGLLVALTCAAVTMAVVQDAKALAVLGAIGGFLAPIAASDGSGDHVVLFSYYALLNAGIFVVAWFKAWRELNLLGFLFTFGVGTVWGAESYTPVKYPTTQPFLVLFVLMFTLIPVLYAWRQQPELKGLLDGTLIFGTPLVGFSHQVRLVSHIEFGLAYSSLALAGMYVGLAWLLLSRAPRWARSLVEAYVALGLAFATMTIPFAFDAEWTAIGWSLEGVGLVWLGLRQKRFLARWAGMLLQYGAAIAFALEDPSSGQAPAFLNTVYFSALSISVSGFAIAYLLHRYRAELNLVEATFAHLFFAWALVWWYATNLVEAFRLAPASYDWQASLALWTLTSIIADVLARRARWPAMFVPSLAIGPAALLHLVVVFFWLESPFDDYGGLAWAAALGVNLWALRSLGDRLPHALVTAGHGLIALWVAGIVGWEAYARIDLVVHASRSWPLAAHVLALVLLMEAFDRGWPRYPVGRHRSAYRLGGAIPIFGYILAWIIIVNIVHDGGAYPLPYYPVVNPLDVAQGLVFVSATGCLRRHRALLEEREFTESTVIVVALTAFVGVNGALLRALHHIDAVPYDALSLWSSTVVQTSLSISWTIIAFATMVFATRHQRRVVWISAAVLLAVVVVKLFVVDLSALSAVPRIVSFIVVGLLMLLVGYLSPVPPRKEDSE